MSPFSHISPAAEPGSSRAGGERQTVSATPAGVAGLFAELMAQALSPGLPTPKESAPTPGQTDAGTDDKEQPAVPEQPAKIANLHSGKMPLSAEPLQEMVGNSMGDPVDALNPKGQSNAIQSKPGTAGKSSEKTDKTAKTEKNSPPQTAQPAVSPMLNQILVNQVIAGTVPVVRPIPNPSVKSELNSKSPVPQPAPEDGVAGMLAAGQIKKSSGTVVNGSISSPSEDETAAVAQAPAAATADELGAESAGSAEKNEQNSVSFDALANPSQAKPEVNSAEHQSVDESSSSGQPVTQPPPDFNGMSIAKQDLSVKQAEKTNNLAGQTEKVLPGNTALGAQANTRLAVSSHPEQVAAAAPVSSDALESSGTVAAPAIHSVSVSNTPAVERMQEMVTLNAVRLSDSGNNLMQVVIKPDAGTQLSLELRQHGDGVEVQAVLQNGDFHHLNQQWPELQQRLGQRGIQLAPLASDATAAHSGGGSYQQPQQQAARPASEDYFAGAPARQILPAIAHAPVVAPAREQRGWETWA
jgi:hypothetical protein